MHPSALLYDWLRTRLPEEPLKWLEQSLGRVAQGDTERTLDIVLGMVPRRIRRDDLALDAQEREAAEAARPGWDPRHWTLDGAARVLVLLRAADAGGDFVERFTRLCRTADLTERIAFYAGLPLYPEQARLEPQAAEGLRTNMRAEFEAIAHRNPYPRERFDEHRWNQMVLKALFIGSPLAPIQGLDERANPALAAILRDYAHERWAAGRPVSPELWRCVGPFADAAALSDLERPLTSEDAAERRAATLALLASPDPGSEALLARHDEFVAAARSGRIDWNGVAAET